jgi:hypothetical protein
LVIVHALGMFVAAMLKSRHKLEAENLFLRHQLNIALRPAPPRLRLHEQRFGTHSSAVSKLRHKRTGTRNQYVMICL